MIVPPKYADLGCLPRDWGELWVTILHILFGNRGIENVPLPRGNDNIRGNTRFRIWLPASRLVQIVGHTFAKLLPFVLS